MERSIRGDRRADDLTGRIGRSPDIFLVLIPWGRAPYVRMFELLVYFGGFFGVILAIGQLLSPSPLRYVACVLYLLAALNLVYSMLYYSGQLGSQSLFGPGNVLHLAGLYAIGPLVYGFLDTILGPDEDRRKFYRLHLMPALAVGLIGIGSSVAYRLTQDAALFSKLENALYAITGVHALGYVATAFGLRIFPMLNPASLRREPATVHLVIFGLFALTAVVFALLAQFSASGRGLFVVTGLATTVIFCWTYFLQQSGRDYSQLLRRESLRVRYHRSNLTGIDADAVAVLLDRVMREEELFRRDDINLRELADAVDLTAHQLSEILNTRLDCTYARFLNQYRIAAAKTDLVRFPTRTILQIALDCGFGSKSAFNASFQREVGLTPTEFRRRNADLDSTPPLKGDS